jgi:hypothetical protein
MRGAAHLVDIGAHIRLRCADDGSSEQDLSDRIPGVDDVQIRELGQRKTCSELQDPQVHRMSSLLLPEAVIRVDRREDASKRPGAFALDRPHRTGALA